jgi:hypothetical protein
MNKFFQITFGIVLVSSLMISACAKSSDSTPTLSPDMIRTQAVATFSVGITQTAIAMPIHTPSVSPTPELTLTPTTTNTPTATVTQVLPTDSCYSLAFVKDVTIPDNTEMIPGQTFTKTWRVQNNGSCAWEKGYKLILTSGDAMGGSRYSLTKSVNPGSSLDISIDMTAPKSTGDYTGNWRMTNASGIYFGDYVFVLITVIESPTATNLPPTATLTPTVDETPTETPLP